jgi:methylmalonyl-CoA mutase
VSTQSGGHKTLVPQIVEELRAQGGGDIIVTCGGIIPPRDYPFLEQAGVKAVFGPGTRIPAAARRVLELIAAAQGTGGGSTDAAVGA